MYIPLTKKYYYRACYSFRLSSTASHQDSMEIEGQQRMKGGNAEPCLRAIKRKGTHRGGGRGGKKPVMTACCVEGLEGRRG